MKNFFRKLFKKNPINEKITRAELNDAMHEIGALPGAADQWVGYLVSFGHGEKQRKYLDLRSRIDSVEDKLDKVIKYLDIKEVHTGEDKYIKVKKGHKKNKVKE